MYLPKADIYNALKTLPYAVSQSSDNVFNELPAITFSIGGNQPSYGLDVEILDQNIVVVIDIWAEDSVTNSEILGKVEALMRQNSYRLEFSADVPNTDKKLFHTNTRFIN